MSSEDKLIMRENPYKRVIGRSVLVTGQHIDKGREGIVKDVSLNGKAIVELHIVPIRNVVLEVQNWVIIE